MSETPKKLSSLNSCGIQVEFPVTLGLETSCPNSQVQSRFPGWTQLNNHKQLQTSGGVEERALIYRGSRCSTTQTSHTCTTRVDLHRGKDSAYYDIMSQCILDTNVFSFFYSVWLWAGPSPGHAPKERLLRPGHPTYSRGPLDTLGGSLQTMMLSGKHSRDPPGAEKTRLLAEELEAGEGRCS